MPSSRTTDAMRVGVYRFSRARSRKAAKDRGLAAAEIAVRAEEARRAEEQRRVQAGFDWAWSALTSNVPQVVLGALEAAFEDNEAPAAAVDVEGDRVTVLMMCPDPALVPERKPSITPSGSPSLKKRTKTEFNQLYLSAIASYVLATVKETFAVAPSLRQARLVALRHEPSAGLCADRLVALFAGTFTRDLMRGARWDAIDLTRVLDEVPD